MFQPLTYQLVTPGVPKDSEGLVFAKQHDIRRADDPAGKLICKQLMPKDPLAKFLSPSVMSNPLVYFPSVELPSFIKSPATSRFYSGIPSSGLNWDGVQSDRAAPLLPAPPPPLIAAICVNADSPRPFPLLFAPPAKPLSNLYIGKGEDIDISNIKAFSSPAAMKLMTEEEGVRFDLRIPASNGLTLGLNGVPATIESSAASKDNPAGAILVKFHANPTGSITLGLPVDARSEHLASDRSGPLSTIYRGEGVTSGSPSVSLVFSSPVGSIGIGSSNSPAVNIERQSIIANAPAPVTSEGKIHRF